MKVFQKFINTLEGMVAKRNPKTTQTVPIENFFPKGLPKLDKPLPKDTFTRKNRGFKIKEIIIDPTIGKSKYFKEVSEENKLRAIKYGQENITSKPREVSKKEFDAMNAIQYELEEYYDIQRKLRSGQELSNKEMAFCEKILLATSPTKQEQTVWRIVYPYEGFEGEINKGEYTLSGFSSCSSTYDKEFSNFWGSLKISKKNDTLYGIKPYFLKINLPKGTPVLDCNATYKGKRTRMSQETILMPAKCKVGKIDEELNVIELFYQNP